MPIHHDHLNQMENVIDIVLLMNVVVLLLCYHYLNYFLIYNYDNDNDDIISIDDNDNDDDE